ncbi:MAG: MMPL family transporter [Thermoanaerobaculia bacterium]|nr:MMPL family transporter [Thermoanaerobaculia bacterium]
MNAVATRTAGARGTGWLVGALLLGAVAVPGLLRVQTDNSAEVFYPQASPTLATYHRFVETFGSDRLVRITLVGEDLWETAGQEALERLVIASRAVPGVSRVVDPRDLLPPRSGSVSSRRLRDLTTKGLARHLGLADDEGATRSLAIELAPGSPGERRQTVDSLAELGNAEHERSGFTVHLTGLPILDRALDRSSREIVAVYFPLLALCAVCLLWLALRRLREVVAALLYVGFCLLLTLGGMGWLGVRLNLVVAVLPPVLFVIAMATAVHLLIRFRLLRERGASVDQAVGEAIADKGWPIVWTGVTTFVGFASLALGGRGPVRTLGMTTGAGIIVLTLAALTVLPALLRRLPGSGEGPGECNPFDLRLGRLGKKLAAWSARRCRIVLAVAHLLGVLALVGCFYLQVDSNALHYLAPDHPVRRSTVALEEHEVGSGSVELVLGSANCSEAERFDRQAGLEILASAESLLRNASGVFAVAGPVDIAVAGQAAVANELGPLAPRVDLETGLAALVGAKGPELLGRFLSPDGCTARISLLVGLGSVRTLDRVLVEATRLASGSTGLARTPLEVTGEYPLLLSTQRSLIRTLAVSSLLSLLGILLLFLALTRSFRIAVLAMAPNVWPVVMVFGVMGWVGIPLDIATVMVAAVILGLAVDDTVHTLVAYRRHRRQKPEATAGTAVEAVMERGAPAYVLTSVLLAAGFGVCGLSDFGPTARFGSLAALAMGFVLIGAIVLLPALLVAGGSSLLVKEPDEE